MKKIIVIMTTLFFWTQAGIGAELKGARIDGSIKNSGTRPSVVDMFKAAGAGDKKAPGDSGNTERPAPLRVLTWNLWNLPEESSCLFQPEGQKCIFSVAGLHTSERLPHQARRILSGHYDIVALNEAWTDTTQEGFADLLAGDPDYKDSDLHDAYKGLTDSTTPALGQLPHYVAEMELSPGPGNPGDFSTGNGLGIFTRLRPYPRSDLPSYTDYTHFDHHQCLGMPGNGGYWTLTASKSLNYDPVKGCSAALHTFLDAHPADPNIQIPINPREYPQLFNKTCAGEDCHAYKGIIWVRVWNTRTGAPLNIFVTHTQADYPETVPPLDYQKIRAQQFEQLRAFIKKMARDEDVLVLGDFNTLGDNGSYIFGTPLTSAGEYPAQIAGSGGLAGMGIKDLWRVSSPAQDPGFTRNFGDGAEAKYVMNDNDYGDPYPQRLDYIAGRIGGGASNRPQPCIGHMRVRHDFDVYPPLDGAGHDLSDHWPVEAIITASGSHCSPQTALTVSQKGTFDLNLSIPGPGAYQWLYFPEGGAFRFRHGHLKDGTQIDAEAYYDYNISDPISELPDEYSRELGPVFAVNKPFYLRLKARNDTSYGAFVQTVVEMDGSTFEKAFPIGFTDLGSVSVYGLKCCDIFKHFDNPPNSQPQQSFFFRFNLQQAWNKEPQKMELSWMPTDKNGNWTTTPGQVLQFDFLDSKKNLLSKGAPITLDNYYKPVTFAVPKLPEPAQGLRLAIHRVDTSAPSWFRMGFATDLRKFELLKIVNKIPEDNAVVGWATDEPFVKMIVDNKSLPLLYSLHLDKGSTWSHFNSWSPGKHPDAKNILFKNSLEFNLYESNEVDNNLVTGPFDWTGDYQHLGSASFGNSGFGKDRVCDELSFEEHVAPPDWVYSVCYRLSLPDQ
ncbi:MAG: endonuclease/exonuclease/phosphatase family protein [Desulfuromonadaceae bacterium]|nr:endonuclease/exonuclease/phosphatase family protein [Desulfuromonadaceae bacterium]